MPAEPLLDLMVGVADLASAGDAADKCDFVRGVLSGTGTRLRDDLHHTRDDPR